MRVDSKSKISFYPFLHNIAELIPSKLSASIRLPRHKRIHKGEEAHERNRGFKGFLGVADKERAFSRSEIKRNRLTRGHSFNLSSRCWAVINGEAAVHP